MILRKKKKGRMNKKEPRDKQNDVGTTATGGPSHDDARK